MKSSLKHAAAFALPLALVCAALPAAAQRAKKPPAADSTKPAPIPQPDKTFPKNVIWTLYSFNGKPVTGELTFSIDDNNRGSGISGCNTWSATMVPVAQQRIAMGPIATTKKQCAKEVMQLEVAFLTALHSGPHWDLVGPDMMLKAFQGPGELKFKRSL
jgi:heat shock protein HslJ